VSIRPADLDRLLVHRAIAALGVAFSGACGIHVVALRLGCGRPGLVRVRCPGIGGLRPKRETEAKICADREQQELA
jgi:hypothetical protein